MQKTTPAKSEKPSFNQILDRVIEQVESGDIKLPMEDRLTMGQLIRAGAFESAYNMQSVETETIAHMAAVKTHGKDTKGAYYPVQSDDPNTTPGQELEKSLKGLDHNHDYLGVIKGEQSKKQYIAELDKAAQQFVEANYPGFTQKEKGGT